MKLIDNASGNVSQGITLDSTNKADRYKLSYNCSNIGSGKSFIRIYATLSDSSYQTYFMPIQFSGQVEFEMSIASGATFLQFDVIGDATITEINLETIVDATMEYVKENATYWDRIKEITSNTGKVRTDMLEGLINLTLNAFANESGTITQENGIMTWLNGTTVANSTQAVQITGGAIRIANSKLANGDWNWTTAISGAGINAATIIAETFAALNITGVTITAGTITGGTINGVTIEGSTIYSGNRQDGTYMEITQSGDINGYSENKRTVTLYKNPSGGIYLGDDLDDITARRIFITPDYSYDGKEVAAINCRGVEGALISVSGGSSVLVHDTGINLYTKNRNGTVYIEGDVQITGDISASNIT